VKEKTHTEMNRWRTPLNDHAPMILHLLIQSEPLPC
jgi:hypothetical protein